MMKESEKFELKSSSTVEIKDIHKGDVILLRYDPENFRPEEIQMDVEMFKQAFPNNTTIAIANDMEFLVENAEGAINLLNQMIAHIKICAGTSASKKIIISE